MKYFYIFLLTNTICSAIFSMNQDGSSEPRKEEKITLVTTDNKKILVPENYELFALALQMPGSSDRTIRLTASEFEVLLPYLKLDVQSYKNKIKKQELLEKINKERQEHLFTLSNYAASIEANDLVYLFKKKLGQDLDPIITENSIITASIPEEIVKQKKTIARRFLSEWLFISEECPYADKCDGIPELFNDELCRKHLDDLTPQQTFFIYYTIHKNGHKKFNLENEDLCKIFKSLTPDLQSILKNKFLKVPSESWCTIS